MLVCDDPPSNWFDGGLGGIGLWLPVKNTFPQIASHKVKQQTGKTKYFCLKPDIFKVGDMQAGIIRAKCAKL